MPADLLDIPIADPNAPAPASASVPTPAATPTPAITPPPADQLPPVAVSTVPQLPTVAEMQQHLEQSQVLLTEVPITTAANNNQSPLAALQPQNMLQTQQGPQPMKLASLTNPQLEAIELSTTHKPTPVLDQWIHRLAKPTRMVVAVALTGHSVVGLYESLHFVLTEYPHLEQQLLMHQITQLEVNAVATRAVILLVSTMINMLFAVRILRTKTGHYLHSAVGICLFLLNTYLRTYLATHYDLARSLGGPVINGVEYLSAIFSQLVAKLPFLKQASDTKPPDVVWYQ